MDHITGMPPSVLSIIHRLVHEAGGLRDALCLEGTSKQLSILFRGYTRFPNEFVVQRPDLLSGPMAGSFWQWLATHGHRLDALTFNQPCPGPHSLPQLADQPGVAQARALRVTCSDMGTVEPLDGLPNLRHLCCHGWSDRPRPGAPDGTATLQPLASLTGLALLVLGDPHGGDAGVPPSVTCLAPLAALTTLTHLELHGVEGVATLAPLASLTALTQLCLSSMDAVTSLEPLAPLGPTLRALSLKALPSLTTLEPLTALTSLTSLALNDLYHLRGDLAPLSALARLRRLSFECMTAPSAAAELDLTPLSVLEALDTLSFHGCTLLDLRPLAPTLTSLRIEKCTTGAHLRGPIASLTALRFLRLLVPLRYDPDYLCPLTDLRELHLHASSLTTLEPLTALASLEHLELLYPKDLGADWAEPLGRLGALSRLHLLYGTFHSLEPLSTLQGLVALHLVSCQLVRDLTPLCGLAGLRQLHVGGCSRVARAAAAALLAALPELCITGL